MLKYDLKVLKLTFTELALGLVESVPSFVKYFVKETDLEAIAGRLQNDISRLEDEIDDLETMLRERSDSFDDFYKNDSI